MTLADTLVRFRDLVRKYVPPWLANRPSLKKTTGYRFLWMLVAPLDVLRSQLFDGIRSWYPGRGTPTALPHIGRSRLLARNQGETDADYASRLIAWLETHEEAGSELRTARAVHEFLLSRPRVRVIARWGLWTTVDEDGTVTQQEAPWDWDSVSHPERSDPAEPWWSDLWMVVYMTTQWPVRPGTVGDLTGDDGFALGHMATHEEVDAVKGLLAQWKAAHSRFRAVIFTSDETLFDPDVPASCPDGTWGSWKKSVAGEVVPSRNVASCRFWEPR